MPVIKVEKPFKHSPDGIRVNEYDKGDYKVPDDMSDDVAELAIGEGWAVAVVERKAVPTGGRKSSSSNTEANNGKSGASEVGGAVKTDATTGENGSPGSNTDADNGKAGAFDGDAAARAAAANGESETAGLNADTAGGDASKTEADDATKTDFANPAE